MPANKTVVFSAPLIFPVTSPGIENGAIAVREGRAVSFGKRSEVLREVGASFGGHEEIRLDGVVTPGLINAHTHLQYTNMRRLGQERYASFAEWTEIFNSVYDPLGGDPDSPWGEWAAIGAREMLASGTTACAEIVTDSVAAGVLAAEGLGGIAYREAMGYTDGTWAKGGAEEFEEKLALIPEKPGRGISPHTAYTLDPDAFIGSVKLARMLGLRIHTHLGELAMEADAGSGAEDTFSPSLPEFSFRRFPLAADGKSATRFLEELGVFEGQRPGACDIHVAHAIYMDEADRAILRRYGVAAALCPRSNVVLAVGEPPIATYLREGNALAVGTDSLSSTPTLDLLGEVAMLADMAKRQGYGERNLHRRLLEIATAGGAYALGEPFGFASGKADFACFDIEARKPADALAELTEAGEGSCIATVLAGSLYGNNNDRQGKG